jgi:hypothetical protein
MGATSCNEALIVGVYRIAFDVVVTWHVELEKNGEFFYFLLILSSSPGQDDEVAIILFVVVNVNNVSVMVGNPPRIRFRPAQRPIRSLFLPRNHPS